MQFSSGLAVAGGAWIEKRKRWKAVAAALVLYALSTLERKSRPFFGKVRAREEHPAAIDQQMIVLDRRARSFRPAEPERRTAYAG